jgi:Putative metal-binding motif/FlgD Ig-like domain
MHRTKLIILSTLILTLAATMVFADIWYRDQDGDGWGDDGDFIDSPTQPAGYVPTPGDCHDQNNQINPGATEYPGDGLDSDCDGMELCYADSDYDGWSINTTVLSGGLNCDGPGEHAWLTNPQDCNDADDQINPGMPEIPGDGVDTDCDGSELCYADLDDDGWATPNVIVSADMDCMDSQEEPAPSEPVDCDDYDAMTHPGAVEIWYDGTDQNCDGYNDYDMDQDGYVAEGYSGQAGGTAPGMGDCADGDSFIHPGAVEICDDAIDQDCDGFDLASVAYFHDSDGDGYGDPDFENWSCVDPGTGWVLNNTDCDDTIDTIYPGAPEICGDGIDNNCNDLIDEDCTVFEILDVADVGNDQGGQLRLTWRRHSDDQLGVGDEITAYDVYRRIDAFKSASGNKAWPPGDWDFIKQVPASGEDSYNTVAPALCDSTDAGVCWSVYFLRARTASTYVFHDTPADSGYSIDNLAPAPPLNLTAAYHAAGVDLNWADSEAEDFDYFRIYRAADPDFAPEPGLIVQTTSGTAWNDPVAGAWSYHYKITAVDFSGNESQAAVAQSTSGVDTPALTGRLVMHANVPNPFNPSTTFRFELPGDQHVRLEIYALSGRRVKTLVDGTRSKGLNRVVWDGRGNDGQKVASGSYICRLDSGGRVLTQRVSMLK